MLPTFRQRSEWRAWHSGPRPARPQRTTGWRDRRTSSGGCCKSHSPADAGCWRRRTPSKPFDRAADAKKRDTWDTPRTCTPAPAKRGRQTSTFTNYIWRAWSHGNSGTPLSNKPLEAFVRFMCLIILMCWLLNPCPGIATNLVRPSWLATSPIAKRASLKSRRILSQELRVFPPCSGSRVATRVVASEPRLPPARHSCSHLFRDRLWQVQWPRNSHDTNWRPRGSEIRNWNLATRIGNAAGLRNEEFERNRIGTISCCLRFSSF